VRDKDNSSLSRTELVLVRDMTAKNFGCLHLFFEQIFFQKPPQYQILQWAVNQAPHQSRQCIEKNN
jgi:hypothetical protein